MGLGADNDTPPPPEVPKKGANWTMVALKVETIPLEVYYILDFKEYRSG